MIKIQQHFYTRERRGLYRHSEGYDSIAKSPGLPDVFIKEKIHPYCTYSPPAQKSLTAVHYPCGRMLFGQAAYVPEDFTGQRSTFFCHNYIIPPEMAGDLLADIGKLLSTHFETSYDSSLGGALEPLDTLPVSSQLQTPPKVGEGVSKIIEYIIESINSGKKTYVIVPTPISEMHDYVRALLAEIYPRLPETIKHQLGFTTYTREPEQKKGIHLMFLPKDLIRPEDPRLAGNFLVHINNADENNNNECDIQNDTAAYLLNRISKLTPPRFFPEIDFWRARLPHYHDIISMAEYEWLEKNFNSLTPPQLTAIPTSFIKRGTHGENPAIYVILSIIKAAYANQATRNPIDIRYLLGSYFLSAANYDKIVENLRRLNIEVTYEHNPNNI